MNIDISIIVEIVLAAGLGMIGFFLRGIYEELKQLSTDVRRLGESMAAHDAHRVSMEQRLNRLEAKVDEIL